MTPLLSLDQRSLFGDLSQRLALRAIRRCCIDFGEYQGWFWHSGVNSYRKALGLLEQAGVFRVAREAMLQLNVHEIEISSQLQAYSAKIGPEQLDLCIDDLAFDAMDWDVCFLLETGFAPKLWRPVIRGHAVTGDIIAPIRKLSETKGPTTHEDAAAVAEALVNIRSYFMPLAGSGPPGQSAPGSTDVGQ